MIRQYFVQTSDPLWVIRVQAPESGNGDIAFIRNPLSRHEFNLTNVLKPSVMRKVRVQAHCMGLNISQPMKMAYRRVYR